MFRFVNSWKTSACWNAVWRRPCACARPSWPWWGWLAPLRWEHLPPHLQVFHTENTFFVGFTYVSDLIPNPPRRQQGTPSPSVTKSASPRLSTSAWMTPGSRGWSSSLTVTSTTVLPQGRSLPTYHLVLVRGGGTLFKPSVFLCKNLVENICFGCSPQAATGASGRTLPTSRSKPSGRLCCACTNLTWWTVISPPSTTPRWSTPLTTPSSDTRGEPSERASKALRKRVNFKCPTLPLSATVDSQKCVFPEINPYI